jgi:hypothetical protein
MTTKQTSDAVSSIAADLANITLEDIHRYLARPGGGADLVRKIRSVAASAWSQDETKGKRS